MNGGVFLGILIISRLMLADELHIDILVVQHPDTKIEFEEEIRSAKITEKKAAIPFADEILVITELEIEIFPGIEIDGGAVVEVVDTCLLEDLVIPCARHPTKLVDPIHKISGSPLL